MALFDYIAAFHNQRRRQTTRGQISPAAPLFPSGRFATAGIYVSREAKPKIRPRVYSGHHERAKCAWPKGIEWMN